MSNYWDEPFADRRTLVWLGQRLISDTYPRAEMNTTSTLPSQTIFASAIGLRAGDKITNIVCAVAVAAAGTTPTSFSLAILNKYGIVLRQTANLAASSSWTSIGLAVCPLTAPLVITESDLYYCAILKNGVFGATEPTIGRTVLIAAATAGPIGSGVAINGSQAGQAAFQANGGQQTLTPATSCFWFGVN